MQNCPVAGVRCNEEGQILCQTGRGSQNTFLSARLKYYNRKWGQALLCAPCNTRKTQPALPTQTHR